MNETPQQYSQRILGHVGGKDPLKAQSATAKKLERLVKGKCARFQTEQTAGAG